MVPTLYFLLVVVIVVVVVTTATATTSAFTFRRPAVGKQPSISSSTGIIRDDTDVASSSSSTTTSLKFPRTWVPLASAYELDPQRPNEVWFLGKSYVVYQNQKQSSSYSSWIVVDGTCPHRLAPLSEGRIDPITQHLECSYHGWTFDANGTCIRIPQASVETERLAFANPRCHITSYPVWIEKNVLFFWPWSNTIDPLSVIHQPYTQPEHMLQYVRPNCSTYTRDLPYGWDTLMENLVDVSHVPWAHHGLQGQRTDAIPINMTTPLHGILESGFVFEFADRTMGKHRTGFGEYLAPFVLSYGAVFDEPTNSTTTPKRFFNLTTVMIPTKPGWSRIILFGPSSQTQDEKKKKKKESTVAKLFRILPTWIVHIFNSRFLDSDLAFLHFQERNGNRQRGGNSASGGSGYFMPAPADRSIIALRKWIELYAPAQQQQQSPQIQILPPPMEMSRRKDLFDRWMQHSDQCKCCTGAKKGIQTWRKRTYGILALSVMGIHKTSWAGIIAAGCILLLRIYHGLEMALEHGGFKHYENH